MPVAGDERRISENQRTLGPIVLNCRLYGAEEYTEQ